MFVKNIVDGVKKSMGLKTTHGFTKGISSHDICKFLRELKKEYKALCCLLKLLKNPESKTVHPVFGRNSRFDGESHFGGGINVFG